MAWDRPRRSGPVAGPDRRRIAQDMLTQAGLAGPDSAWPSVLSGGQKQRVAWARALTSHPRLLAFDEPLGALTRIEMRDLIERVWQTKGFTAIVVTHDVAEAVATPWRRRSRGGSWIGCRDAINP